jgi:DNA-binding CsgD family transcriptional regulator
VRRTRIAVADEHELFRRGVLTALADEPWAHVVHASPDGAIPASIDVAVVSPRTFRRLPADVAALVCRGPSDPPLPALGTRPVAIVERDELGADELLAATRALAAGLRVERNGSSPSDNRLDSKSREILRMLSAGGDTRSIAESLYYSERTVKGLIRKIEDRLGARNRAEAVAKAIRLGLI